MLVISSRIKTTASAKQWECYGRLFQVYGPTKKKSRSPNFCLGTRFIPEAAISHTCTYNYTHQHCQAATNCCKLTSRLLNDNTHRQSSYFRNLFLWHDNATHHIPIMFIVCAVHGGNGKIHVCNIVVNGHSHRWSLEMSTGWAARGPWLATGRAVVFRPALLKIFATISK